MGADPFDLTGRVVVITGGAGLLGQSHARAIRNAGRNSRDTGYRAGLGRDEAGWIPTPTTFVAISRSRHSCRRR